MLAIGDAEPVDPVGRAEQRRAETASDGQAARRQVERLSAPDQMGELFQVAALHSPGLRPPGFGDAP